MKIGNSAILLLCFMLFAGVGLGQEDKAVLTGTATDPSGAILPGAVVELSCPVMDSSAS
jgi:hypothetical protein